MRFSGKTVLVTGGSGFIGSRLVEKLILEEGANVRVLVRNWHKATWVSRTSADLLPGDVTDQKSIADALAGVDVVFHCASGGSTREQYFAINVEGTRNVLDAAARRGTRLVYVSSSAVHGPVLTDGMNEHAPFVLTGKAYGESKIAAEQLVDSYEDRVAATVIRPTFVWGPRSHLFTVGPAKAMAAGRFRLVNNGTGRCHAVYVDNLVESLLLAATEDSAVGRKFIVTDCQSGLTWREFFRPIAELVGRERLKSVSAGSPLIRRTAEVKSRLEATLNRLAGSPAPLLRRVRRRLIRETIVQLDRFGIPPVWDLEKFSQTAELDLSSLERDLKYRPVVDFETAVRDTVAWLKFHFADELCLNA